MQSNELRQRYIGAIILPLRLIAGWLFFSAFWRRVILVPEKHVMESAQWLGHKINTFYPHSNGLFKSMLEHFVENPDAMNVFTWVFTISELLAGILLFAGFLSRLSGLLLVGLSIGLMHTAGWLGPTCLDEWQISSLLVTIGLVITLFGSGRYSLDSLISYKKPALLERKWWKILALPLPDENRTLFNRLVYFLSGAVFLYVLLMNQVHHGGLWGKLHNYSKFPDIQVTQFEKLRDHSFQLNLYRDKGPETYGSFLIRLDVIRNKGDTLHTFNNRYMQNIKKESIDNQYINKIQPGENSLLVPLGAKADVTFRLPEGKKLIKGQEYTFVFTDISGRKFSGKTKD
ncbi:MAG: TQO small subunit DoxD [Bacteroidota bacterium]